MKRIISIAIIVILMLVLIPCEVAQADTLSQAELRIQQQYNYLHAIYPNAPAEWCYAISTVNYVSNYICPRLYVYWTNTGVMITNGTLALQYGAGLCGTQTYLFMNLLASFNVITRTVQCFNIDPTGSNHIFAEVWYNNQWNMFDCTLGGYFTNGADLWDTQSFAEVRADVNYLSHLKFNDTNIYYLGYTGAGLDVLSYVTSPTVEIVYGIPSTPPPPTTPPPTTPPPSGTTITIQPTVKDATLNQGAPDLNLGAANIWVRGHLTGGCYRSVIEFSPDWDTLIPSGATIESATLELYYAYYTEANPSGMTVNLYRLTQNNWMESSVTWNMYQAGYYWATGGGDYDSSVVSSASVPSSPGAWVSWNVLSYVNYVLANDLPLGLLLRDSIESGTAGINAVFNASNAADPALHPKLTIVYSVEE